MNVGILGVLPWREVVESEHIASDLMLRTQGARRRGRDDHDHLDGRGLHVRGAAGLQPNSLRGGRAGHFFRSSPRLTRRASSRIVRSCLVGGLATLACLADLGTVITALLDFADPDPVRRPDRNRLLLAVESDVPRSHVPHAFYPAARTPGPGWLALCVRGFRAPRHALWRSIAARGRGRFFRLGPRRRELKKDTPPRMWARRPRLARNSRGVPFRTFQFCDDSFRTLPAFELLEYNNFNIM